MKLRLSFERVIFFAIVIREIEVRMAKVAAAARPSPKVKAAAAEVSFHKQLTRAQPWQRSRRNWSNSFC